jgi:hypothetical protein
MYAVDDKCRHGFDQRSSKDKTISLEMCKFTAQIDRYSVRPKEDYTLFTPLVLMPEVAGNSLSADCFFRML